jgi:hypothetical protein
LILFGLFLKSFFNLWVTITESLAHSDALAGLFTIGFVHCKKIMGYELGLPLWFNSVNAH